MKKRSGFTLIELLVVISIIGVLSAIGLSTFSGAQKKARDARRRADLKQIQNAMEQYYINYGTYNIWYWDSPMLPYLPNNSGTSYNVIDPRGTWIYGGGSSVSVTSYRFCADMENDGVFTKTDHWNGNADVCVTNLQ